MHSNSSVALVHGMSRPIGAFYHVPHGLSNAMLLPTVTEFSIPAAPERYSKCAKAIGIANFDDSIEESNKKLLDELKQLNLDLEVPTLEEFGVEKKTFLQKISPHLGISLNEVKELLSTSERDFSYLTP